MQPEHEREVAHGDPAGITADDRLKVDREIRQGQSDLLSHLRGDVKSLEQKILGLQETITEQRETLQDQNRMIAGLTSVAEDLRRELRLSLGEAANFRALDTFMTALKNAKRNGNGDHT